MYSVCLYGTILISKTKWDHSSFSFFLFSFVQIRNSLVVRCRHLFSFHLNSGFVNKYTYLSFEPCSLTGFSVQIWALEVFISPGTVGKYKPVGWTGEWNPGSVYKICFYFFSIAIWEKDFCDGVYNVYHRVLSSPNTFDLVLNWFNRLCAASVLFLVVFSCQAQRWIPCTSHIY